MGRKFIFMAAVLCLVSSAGLSANAQDDGFMGRISVDADWKVAKGFHIDAGYELRTEDSFDGIERHQFNLGVSYKFNKYLRGGLGYSFIGHYTENSSDFEPRHRAYAFLTGSVDVSQWRFSLRETLLYTHKAYSLNRYQETRNTLGLKSRVKVSYRGFDAVEPYAYAEIRNALNDPKFSAVYNTATGEYSDYDFVGYKYAYLNRVRGAIGAEWKIDKHNALDFRLMLDYNKDRDIDTNKEGSTLKSYTKPDYFNTILAVDYKFSF